jgi:hypothetical protein
LLNGIFETEITEEKTNAKEWKGKKS